MSECAADDIRIAANFKKFLNCPNLGGMNRFWARALFKERSSEINFGAIGMLCTEEQTKAAACSSLSHPFFAPVISPTKKEG